MGETLPELVANRDQMMSEAKAILDRAGDADLAGVDAEQFDKLAVDIEERNADITRMEDRLRLKSRFSGANLDHARSDGGGGGGGYKLIPGTAGGDTDQSATRRKDRGLAGAQVLTREQSIDTWCRDNNVTNADEPPLSFDKYLRGICTNQWDGAEHERALSVGTATAGGHLVPAPLSATVIDLARNASRVVQAGAQTVPMTAATLKMARLTGEGTPAWRNENAAVTAGDLVFDAVTFTARSLARLVLISRELFEDSDPAADDVIARSFAAQMAMELDRVALRGSGTPPEPRGVLNASGITTTTHGTNGAAIGNYDWFLDAAGAVLANNFAPNAHIVAPRTVTSLSKLKEATTSAYLAPPASLLPILPTGQIPINLTVGTSEDCTEIYTAQWNQLAIGIRTGFELEFLRERYADNLQYGFLAHLRADVQLLQPKAFVVDTGVRG